LAVFYLSLLPCHRDAKGVFRVNQVIHALGGVGNRELDALDFANDLAFTAVGPPPAV
jgi:hypothetical protein